MRFESAEAFILTCESEDPQVSRLAATGEASEAVWTELILHHPEWRYAVTLNKNLPDTILTQLAEDPSLRMYVAMKRRLPRNVFEQLAADPEIGVRQKIARNVKTPQDILEGLLEDPNRYVRASAKENLEERKAKLQKKSQNAC